MKRFLVLLLSAAMLLSLCGCMQEGLSDQGTEAGVPETTRPLSDRDPETRIEYVLEGSTERQDATLYVGNGYSIYITNDGWLPTYGANGDVSWRSRYNGEITLSVIPNAGATAEDVQNTLFAGYTGLEQDGEYVYGYKEEGQLYRAARLIETPNGFLVAVWNYNLESAEGFGARLRILAGTLMIED